MPKSMTIRLSDDVFDRLFALAQSRRLSVNDLMEQISDQALLAHEFDLRWQAHEIAPKPGAPL